MVHRHKTLINWLLMLDKQNKIIYLNSIKNRNLITIEIPKLLEIRDEYTRKGH